MLTYGANDGGTASALPSWLQVDAASGTLHGTPTNDAVGNLSVVVTRDGPSSCQRVGPATASISAAGQPTMRADRGGTRWRTRPRLPARPAAWWCRDQHLPKDMDASDARSP